MGSSPTVRTIENVEQRRSLCLGRNSCTRTLVPHLLIKSPHSGPCFGVSEISELAIHRHRPPMLGDGGEDGFAVAAIVAVGKFDAFDESELPKNVLRDAVCRFGYGNPVALRETVLQAPGDKGLSDA